MFNNRLRWEGALIYNICPFFFLWYKYSHSDQFQATNLTSANVEFGREVHKGPSVSSPSWFQYTMAHKERKMTQMENFAHGWRLSV